MKTLQQLLPAEIRARLSESGDLPPDDGTPLSECSCSLPKGWWGRHGWHLRKTTPEEVGARFKADYLASLADLAPSEQQAAWEGWLEMEKNRGRLDEQGIHRAWKADSGRTIYHERCPAKMARQEAAQQQLKLTAATTRAAKPRLD